MAEQLPRDSLKDGDEQVENIGSLEAQYETDPTISKRISRKFDLHIIPWLFGIWLFAFIDRSNIGNAKIDGLTEDLKLTGNKFNVALTVFYVPYICVDVPSNWIMKHFKAGYYLPFLIISWGIVSTCLGFVKSYGGLIAGRFFLGLCEGGLLGGMVIYLAMFYQRHELMYRIGLFYCAAPLSGAFGGLLATGLAQIKHGGYSKWPWIFIIEGIITIVWGLTAILFLPHTPNESKFLSEEERTMALHRMRMDSHGATNVDDVGEEKFHWRWVRMALLSPNTWFTSLAWFFNLHWTSTESQLFTVPPNFCAFVLVLMVAALSDKFKTRGPPMLVGYVLAIVGYIMLLAGGRPSVKYGGTFLVACGVFPNSVMVMGWLANNLAPHYVRATGTGFQISIANCAAFIATFTYLQKDAPKYALGHSINIGSLCLGIVTVACGIIYCKWENCKRDRGDRDDRLKGDQSILGHRHPRFRYAV